ncbi:MAG: cupredoxin domain-containing protein [Patescibacteria group bacterium]
MSYNDLINEKPLSRITKKMKLSMVLVLLVLVLVVVFFLISNKKSQLSQNLEPTQNGVDAGATNSAATDAADNNLPNANTVIAKDTRAVVPGGNAVDNSGRVVTEDGVVTTNSVAPMSDNAPKQTGFLKKEELSATVFKIDVGNKKFVPNEFTTKTGRPTTFALTSIDKEVHNLSFTDPRLSAVAVVVGPNQTGAITFNAPEPGVYTFHCTFPGHTGDGETGKMIVQ